MLLKQVFEDLERFVATYRGAISTEGMVLRCEKPYPLGTILDVEISLRDARRLVKGRAGVVAFTEGAPIHGGRWSVTLEFVDLADDSARLIDRLEKRLAREGIQPFRIVERWAAPPLSSSEVQRRLEDHRRRPGQDDLADAPPPATGVARGHDETPSDGGLASPESRSSALVANGAAEASRGSGAAARNRRWPSAKPAAEAALGASGGGRTRARKWLVAGAVLAAITVFGLAAIQLLPRRMNPPSPPATRPPAPVAPTIVSSGQLEEPASSPELDSAHRSPPATTLPAADPTAASAASGGRSITEAAAARAIVHIEVSRDDHETVLTAIADGPLAPHRVRHSRLDDPPRVLLRIRDVTDGYPVHALPVDGRHVKTLRTWHHLERTPPELHVVLDLAHSDVVADAPVVEGEILMIRLRSRE